MIFHFDLIGTDVVTKGADHEFENAVAATEFADRLAAELSMAEPEFAQEGYSVRVKDDQGEEIYRAELNSSVH
ncbi:hypothetical protein V1291_000262 [Nitrobacteraceae bacterium AZCC 1564]